MIEIPLTRGQVAIIDDEDLELVSKHKWCAQWNHHTRTFYAVTNVPHPDGGFYPCGEKRRTTVYMHRLILGLGHGNPLQGDHRNQDTLDNRRANLRIVTNQKNLCNRGIYQNNRLGVQGISRNGRGFRARIQRHGEERCLGTFKTVEEAAAVRQRYLEANPDF